MVTRHAPNRRRLARRHQFPRRLALEPLECRALLAAAPFLVDTTLTSHDIAPGDQFGQSVDLDGGVLVVGAPGVGDEQGAAYVFERQAEGWAEQTRLALDAPLPGDLFGTSVAISGETIVVGAPERSSGRSGAAYVFQRDEASWLPPVRLTATSDHTVRDFGAAVAIDGDRILVGAPETDDGHGSAYVFRQEGSNWTQEAELFISDFPPSFVVGGFGTSIDIDGDSAVVGAPREAGGFGNAYVYHRDGRVWQPQAGLNRRDNVGLGTTVAIYNDTLVVRYLSGRTLGFFAERSNTSIYQKIGQEWVETTAFDRSDHAPTSENAALDADHLIVGDTIYQRDDTSWNRIADLDIADAITSVAIDGPTVAIGSPAVQSQGTVRLATAGAEIRGHLWDDANRDGRRDANEQLLEGVVVRVLDEALQVIASRTTARGEYSLFVAPGAYAVEVVLPANTQFSPMDQGDDASDSDVDPTAGRTIVFQLATGETATYDAGLGGSSQHTAIEGLAWLDRNEDGIRDNEEAAMPNVRASLFNRSSELVAETTTATDGTYVFRDAAPGAYRVVFEAPVGFRFSPADQGLDDSIDSDVSSSGGSELFSLLAQQEAAGPHVGLVPLTRLLEGFIWDDVDRDGIRDADEMGVPGVAVELLDGNLEVVQRGATSEPTGRYRIRAKTSEEYSLRFIAPRGTAFSPQHQGEDRLLDSDPDPATGRTDVFFFNFSDPPRHDAGLYGASSTTSVEGVVWFDRNANGIRETEELPASGVIVTLLGNSPHSRFVTATNSDGTYSFSAFPPGTYLIDVDPPTGFAFSPPDMGADDTIDSDVELAAGNTPIFTVLAGQAVVGPDAGLVVAPGTFRGVVWEDSDRNGIRDPDETGVEGVTVQLLDESLSVMQTARTNSQGAYQLNASPGVRYSVQFIAPSGTAFSPRHQGSNPEMDSDPDPANGRTVPVALPANAGVRVDAGLYGASSETGIEGLVWFDENGNGIRDAGEAPIPDVPVLLVDSSGAPAAAARTNRAGSYALTQIDPGTYRVRFNSPPALRPTAPHHGTDDSLDSDIVVFNDHTMQGFTLPFTLIDGQRATSVDAGFIPNVESLGGVAWNDSNHDGIRDPAERGIEGISVRLLDERLRTVAATMTDTSGEYRFDRPVDGEYRVEFVAPPGAHFSPAKQGNDSTLDSDPDPATGLTAPFTLFGGVGRLNDAGLFGTDDSTQISGRVWEDNGDGIRDPETEVGAADVEIRLLDGNLSVVTTTRTDADGGYRFQDIEPGRYAVAIDVPPDATLVPINRGGDDTTDSDLNRSTARTDVSLLISNIHIMDVDAGIYRGPTSAEVRDFLRITELMFDGREGQEYIELKNIGPDPLNLTGVRFIDGVAFDFSSSDVTILFPDEYVVISRSPREAFAQWYDMTEMNFAGSYQGWLENDGERIELVAPINRVIHAFTYAPRWFPLSKSMGLTVRNEHAIKDVWDDRLGWRPGSSELGTPGRADPLDMPEPGAVVINEIMSNSSRQNADGEFNDWIELHNTTDRAIDIGGWYLGDGDLDGDNLFPTRYRIAAGTIVPAGGYVTFSKRQHFGNPNDAGATSPFGLSSFGEVVYLVGGDVQGARWDYVESARFSAAATNVSFGRHLEDQRQTFSPNFDAVDPNVSVNIEPNQTATFPFEPDGIPGQLVDLVVRLSVRGQGASVALVSPTGTREILVEPLPEAGLSVPVELTDLDVFTGEDPNGVWQLEVTAANAGATFWRWNMEMTTDVNAADFVAMDVPTFGGPNSLPRVGPVVINEIMYHEAFLGDEFIELHNISGAEIDVSSWSIGDGVDFQIPSDTRLPADGYLLVVPTEPDAFREKWSIPATVPVVGPYRGSLDNAGEDVSLYRLETDQRGRQLRILTDRVAYDNRSPWPREADQGGGSLERILPFRYGDDVDNWAVTRVANGTPGRQNSVTSYLAGDMDLSGQIDMDDIDDFVMGLEDPFAYGQSHGVAPRFLGDMDGDQDFDFDDVAGFAAHFVDGADAHATDTLAPNAPSSHPADVLDKPRRRDRHTSARPGTAGPTQRSVTTAPAGHRRWNGDRRLARETEQRETTRTNQPASRLLQIDAAFSGPSDWLNELLARPAKHQAPWTAQVR